MKKALVIQNWTIVAVFALLIGIVGLIAGVRGIDPLFSNYAEIAKTSNGITLNIGSMVSLGEDDEGKIEMSLDSKTQQVVRVAFERKGEKDGYEIEENGWYVIVSSGDIGKEIYSVSRIHAYPPVTSDDMRELNVIITAPSKVCIVKEKGKKYPRVKEWLTIC